MKKFSSQAFGSAIFPGLVHIGTAMRAPVMVLLLIGTLALVAYSIRKLTESTY